jgi:WD40 repeat protein
VPDWFRIEAASDPIVAITFDSSGRFVVTAAGKGGLKVWDLASRQPVLEARDHDAPVKHIALSSDGTLLITAADDGRIVVVDREANRITRLVHHDCAVVHALAFDSATGRIAIACDDFTVRRFEAGGDEAKVLRGSTGAFHSLAFSPDGDSLAAGSDRGAISIWNASTGALEERRDELTDRVVDLAFRSDGDELIAVAADGTALRWSLADSGTEPSRIHLEVDDPTIATIASSGDFLAYEREGSVGVIDVERDRALRRMQPLPDEIDITSIAISSDGRWFAAGGSRGLVLLNPIEAAW